MTMTMMVMMMDDDHDQLSHLPRIFGQMIIIMNITEKNKICKASKDLPCTHTYGVVHMTSDRQLHREGRENVEDVM
eukprot:6152707-Amphidinium_carterae.1